MPVDKTFAMRLAPDERRQIERLARARGTSMKGAVLGAVRDQLEALPAEEPFAPRPGGPLDGLDDIVGCFDSGLSDLSTNPDHLDGYGA